MFAESKIHLKKDVLQLQFNLQIQLQDDHLIKEILIPLI